MATILCIEDEKNLREAVVEELEDAGYKTLQAENGLVGLDLIIRHNPNLILCDVSMPVMNGEQLLKELRQNHPELAEIPLIFLTAHAHRDDMLSGIDLGADEYLTKPIDFDLLLTKVSAAINQVGRIKDRHHVETEEAVLRTLNITMSTVQDVVGNFLQNLLLFRLEAEKSGALKDDSLQLFDDLVEDTKSKLQTISSLEAVIEKSKDSGIPTLDTTAGKEMSD